MGEPFRYRRSVRFSDVDHAGIVYYPRFFHYFHEAFEEFFRDRVGARAYVDLLDVERIGFPAVASACDYKAPLRFGDDIEVAMSCERIGNKSVTFRYRVYRIEDERTTEVLAADGTVTCAVVDLVKFRAREIPPKIRTLFEQISS